MRAFQTFPGREPAMAKKRPGPPKRVSIPARAEALFRLLEAVAVRKERCPVNPVLGDSVPSAGQALSHLIAAGRVRTEVYGHNYRVVEILTGPNRGARTAEHPAGGKPTKVNGILQEDRGGSRDERGARGDVSPGRSGGSRIAIA